MLPKIGKLLLAILICQAAGILGMFATQSSVDSWYQTLEKPWFTPPDWLFGPVWILLYTLMGIALYLIWQNRKVKTNRGVHDNQYFKSSLIFFYLQLFLNALWSYVFFYFRMPWLGFIEIVLLWAAIIITILFFTKVKKLSAYLMIPYLLWVTYAAALNLAIAILN